jgi:hypothetical protein
MRSIPVWYKDEVAHYALVDDEDFELVNLHKWYLMTRGTHRKRHYAQAFRAAPNGRRQTLYMHRVILGLTEPTRQADHIDGNGLNNTQSNLRPATQLENGQNRQKSATKAYAGRPTSSRFRGVSWETGKRRWRAQLRLNGKQVFSRLFRTELEAARAVAEARARLMPFSQDALALQRAA